MTEAMRDSLRKFDEFNQQRKLSITTRVNQLDPVLDFGLFLFHKRSKDRYEAAIEEDFVSYQVEVSMPKSVAQLTRTVLRKFYWLLEGEGRGRNKTYPEKVEALEPPQANGDNEEFAPEKVPYYREMAEHVKTLVRAMNHPRDRAIIFFAFDTGARLDEVVGLTIGALTLHREYGIVALHGKTGLREVTFVRALPYLTTWLNMHPEPENREAPLWVALGGGHGGESMKYSTVGDVFGRAAKASGLPLSAHDLRHGRATETAQLDWNEEKMRKFFGWRPGSNMPTRYTHLAAQDIQDQVLSDAGIEPRERSEPAGMPVRCPRCREMNEPSNRFCKLCGIALSLEAAERLEGRMERLDDTKKIAALLEDPKVRELLSLLDRVRRPPGG